MRRLVHMSDLHFGRHDTAIAEDLLSSVEAARSDVVIISGDLTQRARRDEFVEARRFLDRIAAPKIIVPGNHDIPLYHIVNRVMRPFANYAHYIEPVSRNAFIDAEIAVIGVNTARRFKRKDGRISLEKIDEIQRVFGGLPAPVARILVTHHPLGFPDLETVRSLLGRSRRALEAMTASGDCILLSGHHHETVSGGSESHGKGAVLMIHAGTAISTRLRGGGGNSYNVIEIDDAEVSVQIMEWVAQRGFVARRTVAYRRRTEGWRA